MGGSGARRRRLRRRRARMKAMAVAAGACSPSSSPLTLKDGAGHGDAPTSAHPLGGGAMAAAGGCDCASLAGGTAEEGIGGASGEDDENAPWVPTMGEQVDAMDLSGKWQEGVVVGVLDEENHHVYRVHFRGWGSHWDESIELESGRMRPAYTVLRRWRDRLRVGDSVEIRHPQNPQQWIWAQVEQVDAESGRVRCGDGGAEWVSVYSEDITAPNTHFSQSFGKGSHRLRDACGQIVEPGVEPHDTDIHRRAMLGDESGMRVLLNDDPEGVNAVGRDRMTPLLLAAAHHRVEVLDVLVETGADVGAVSRTARGPLHLAIFHRSHPLPTLPVVAKLLSYGCDPNTQDLRLATPLTMAAENQPEVGELLVKCGADVGLTDMGGSTALHMACFAGHVGLVRTLLRAGAEPLAVDAHGQRPEDVACLKSTVLRPLRAYIVDVLHDSIRCIQVKNARRVRDRLKARSQGRLPSSESKSVDVCDVGGGETLFAHATREFMGGSPVGSSSAAWCVAAAAAPVPAGRSSSSSSSSSAAAAEAAPPSSSSAAAAFAPPQPLSSSSSPASSPPPPPTQPPSPAAPTVAHAHHTHVISTTTSHSHTTSTPPQGADSGYSAGAGWKGGLGARGSTVEAVDVGRSDGVHAYTSSSSSGNKCSSSNQCSSSSNKSCSSSGNKCSSSSKSRSRGVATGGAERWGRGERGIVAAAATYTAAASAAGGVGADRRRLSVGGDDAPSPSSPPTSRGFAPPCSTAPTAMAPPPCMPTATTTSTPAAVLRHVTHTLPHDVCTELVDYFLAP